MTDTETPGPVRLARPGEVSLTSQQQRVADEIELGLEHVFVTGRAGTGKSTLLQHLVAQSSKNLAVCAPTGVAALNVGGQTIHSLFRLPIGVIGDEPIRQGRDVAEVLGRLELLIIDEVSMVNADLIDAIDRSLRMAKRAPRIPFGGVQLALFGDPYQLAPVPGDAHERAFFADRYRSSWFFDAHVWQQAPLTVVELDQVMRQRDPEFAAMLTAVRHGEVTVPIGQALNTAGIRTPPPPSEVVTLATRNATVARINQRELARIDGDVKRAVAEVEGEFPPGSFPADEALELKVGARVMFLRNDAGGEGRWVNGSVGTVRHIDRNVVVEVDGDEHEVTPVAWERFAYRYDAAKRHLDREVVGEFRQFPLRPAWAVTIHKSQGHTYDQAVIDLGGGAFAPGQTYVALSRLRSLEGLYLSRQLRPTDVIVDHDVIRFMGGL